MMQRSAPDDEILDVATTGVTWRTQAAEDPIRGEIGNLRLAM
jgi:hypothetical protein